MSRQQAAALAAQDFGVTPADASRKHLENDPDAVARSRKDIEAFLPHIDMFHNMILVVAYRRPAVTAGGIHRIDSTQEEDIWQGKVGLVVKTGPSVFKDRDDVDFGGQTINENDWIILTPQTGRLLEIGGVKCRVLSDRVVLGKTARPDLVW